MQWNNKIFRLFFDDIIDVGDDEIRNKVNRSATLATVSSFIFINNFSINE